MSRLLTSDPIMKRKATWNTQADGGVVVDYNQDVSDIVEWNKTDFNNRSGFAGKDMHHVARIPVLVYEDLMRKGITKDPAAFKRWLDDPDNRAWRSHPGRLS